MRSFPTLALALVLTLAGATTAHGVLAPTKASQLVTVYSTGTCSLPGFNANASATFNQVVRPDGSIVPFVIPPKQVFVMVDAMLTVAGQVAADEMLAVVALGTPTGGAPVAARFESASPGGTMTATFEFPAGIAVKPGTVMCSEILNFTHGNNSGASAIAHGYFAPDK